MSTWLKVVLAAFGGFLAGGVSGYFLRKSTEPKFEQCTDEEQLAYAIMDEAKQAKKDEKEKDKKDISSKENAFQAINTQKTQYTHFFEDGATKYDKHSELPEGEEPVVSDEQFDKEFINEIEDEDEDEESVETLPNIEESSLEEFYHWNSMPDGEYDTESLYWFEPDDIITGSEGEEIKDRMQYCGFDPKAMFGNKIAVDGDPDALYIKNNKYKTVYEVIRYKNSYVVGKRMLEFGGGGDG